ncbi:uncharacterized protein LOC122576369 [Bombus pyrosoma]|uniref:uncharacterized protein LOC122576369 n=1 Tax=Bombus pyrosoma TaxID=396416 RepID=UPI001CB915D6|nr:uncharacterized protein LOC122576369 [Bombus pyrosoma]XP_043602494.1 uncharacterized protein LOC122576369 [Bombus pyrosoma]XP_043602495.1 uncharacterized protein LOC122576369 [Bombus pyrosoma]
MYFNTYFVLSLLCLTICQAVTAEKKEEIKEELNKKELEIEQTGEDTERSKKSVFIMDQVLGEAQSFGIQTPSQHIQSLNIKQAPGVSETVSIQNPQSVQTLNIQTSQPAQIFSIKDQSSPTLSINQDSGVSETISIQDSQSVQTLSIQTPQSVQTLNIQGSQPVQTLNIKPVSPGVQTLSIKGPQPLQTFSIKPGSQVQTFTIQGSQPLQTFSIRAPNSVQTLSIQPGSQGVQTVNVIQPQHDQTSANVIVGPQHTKTVQVIHPGQGGSQTNVNIVQPSPKEIDVPVVEKITRTEKILEPMQKVVVSEMEKEIVAPVVPIFREQIVFDPDCSCLVTEPETMSTFFKYLHFKYGKPTFYSAVKPKMLIKQPMRVLEVRERSLIGV